MAAAGAAPHAAVAHAAGGTLAAVSCPRGVAVGGAAAAVAPPVARASVDGVSVGYPDSCGSAVVAGAVAAVAAVAAAVDTAYVAAH